MDGFLYWHTQVHSLSETSCSKSPTIHVCAVTLRAKCLRVRLLRLLCYLLPAKPVCSWTQSVELKVPCCGRSFFLPPEAEVMASSLWYIVTTKHTLTHIATTADRFCTATLTRCDNDFINKPTLCLVNRYNPHDCVHLLVKYIKFSAQYITTSIYLLHLRKTIWGLKMGTLI